VTFYSPGTLFAETTREPIETWDPKEAARRATGIKERYSARPYAFRFETCLVTDPVPDGRGGTLRVEEKRTKESGLYHLHGRVWTFEQIRERRHKDDLILLQNMRSNRMALVVETHNSFRSVQEFKAEDVVVDADGAILHRGDEPTFVKYRAAFGAALDAEEVAKIEARMREVAKK